MCQLSLVTHCEASPPDIARCFGPDVENDVQKKQSIFYHLSRSCSSNGVAADEVTAAKYCSAPEPKNWIPGKQVRTYQCPIQTELSSFPPQYGRQLCLYGRLRAAKYCSAPEPQNWIPGKQIYSNCKSIPKYTPVSTFTTGTANGDGTAIFLECTPKGTIMVVRQTCKSKMLELVEISPTLDLFVVDW
ncbi:unnamed protein product [Mytilus edulis]|uniref:Uncharacterized protein n=1 Tax=Mytilus edulis TaxID=6550 RepID=A0A8S3QLV4_MYTED|nr:unnamed protein product [Mytilus edulis]